MKWGILILFTMGASAARRVNSNKNMPLNKRKNGLDSEACENVITVLLPLASSIPSLTPELAEAISAASVTDACEVPQAIPTSILPMYLTYSNIFSSWYKSHESMLSSAISVCPAISLYMTDAPYCTKFKDSEASTTGSLTSIIHAAAASTTTTKTTTSTSTHTSTAAAAPAGLYGGQPTNAAYFAAGAVAAGIMADALIH